MMLPAPWRLSVCAMNPFTHQTITLSRGTHDSPDQGACVMELASMLAGEAFSDHPRAVCPVIGAFLRTYNDSIDDERRRALYAYAAKVVGSRGPEELTRARARHLRGLYADLQLRRHPWARCLPARLRVAFAPRMWMIPRHLADVIAADEGEVQLSALKVIDDLLALGAADCAPLTGGTSGHSLRSDSEPERMLGLRQVLKTSP